MKLSYLKLVDHNSVFSSEEREESNLERLFLLKKGKKKIFTRMNEKWGKNLEIEMNLHELTLMKIEEKRWDVCDLNA